MGRGTSDENLIALIGAGTQSRRDLARPRFRAIERGVDWTRLAAVLRRRRLLGPLGPRIVELSERPDEDFARAVETTIENGRRQSTFLQLTSERILSLLAQDGVRAAPLKGPILADLIYGDPGRRQSNDIDLLVPPDQLRAAVSTVVGLGYVEPEDFLDRDGLPLLHLTMLHERGVLPPVELHWRIHWYERRFAVDRLLPSSPAPPSAWRPAPADELASLLLFYARDGFAGLRLAADLSAWWDRFGSSVPPEGLAEIVDLYPGLARVIPAAVEAAELVIGLPAEVGPARALDRRQRTAVRLANPSPRPDPAEIYATAGLVDGLLAPTGEVPAFLRRQVFPPPEVLEQQAEHGDRKRPRGRFSRAAGILGRYGVALVRASLRMRRGDRGLAYVDR